MIRNGLPSLLFVVGVALAVSGCAAVPSPTHSWEGPVTQVRYNSDNRNCLPDNSPGRAFVTTSEEFVLYKNCMQGRGYEWVALR